VILGPRGRFVIKEAVFMHDPVSLDPLWWPAFVKNKGLLHTKALGPTDRNDWLVDTCCLPVSRTCCPVRPITIRIFSIPWAEEEPFTFTKEGLAWSRDNNVKTANTERVYVIYCRECYNISLKQMMPLCIHSSVYSINIIEHKKPIVWCQEQLYVALNNHPAPVVYTK